MFKKWIVGLTMVLVAAPWAFAQDAVTPAPQMADVSVTQSGNVSLDFRDADIRNVLEILSFKSGVNIVAGPEVTGTVSIKLKEVPWQQALDVILQTYGYAYERKGNIVVVTTIDSLKQRREDASVLAEQEPVETKTFQLKFGKASEVIASVEKMKSERGTINFDQRTNTIIITDTQSRLALMGDVITQLDKTTPQVLIEAKIVETQFSDEENLGVDWLTQATIGGSKRPITWPFKQSSGDPYAADDFQGVDDENFQYGTLDATQIQAVFEMLKSRSDTDILSAPRIVTLDNKPARITVGSQYPIPTYTYNEEQAALQVSGWEYKDIGIIFEVTPHVNSADFVSMEIEPKITAILDFVTVENTSLPRLSNESAKTNVMVKNGETLVIAGLVKDQITDTKKKTPFLGDIPIVGLAFQKTEKTITKTDLMLFITPHVITPDVSGL